MESLEDVLTFLYNRYGSPNAIMQDNLDSLKTLGSPGNMVTVSAVLSICEKDTELSPLWTTARTGRVVNKSLSEAMRTKFWGEFEVFKASSYDTRVASGTITPSDTWEQVFDKYFSSQRISFLLMFLKKELGIMRNMGVGISSKKPKPEQKVKLVNQNEKWLCPYCST